MLQSEDKIRCLCCVGCCYNLLSECDREQWAAGTDADAKLAASMMSMARGGDEGTEVGDKEKGDKGDKEGGALHKEEEEEEGFPLSAQVRAWLMLGAGAAGQGEGRRLRTLGRSVLNLAANTNHATACGPQPDVSEVNNIYRAAFQVPSWRFGVSGFGVSGFGVGVLGSRSVLLPLPSLNSEP